MKAQMKRDTVFSFDLQNFMLALALEEDAYGHNNGVGDVMIGGFPQNQLNAGFSSSCLFKNHTLKRKLSGADLRAKFLTENIKRNHPALMKAAEVMKKLLPFVSRNLMSMHLQTSLSLSLPGISSSVRERLAI